MSKKLSGSQLFLRYAFPCAEDKLRGEEISQGDFEQLRLAVEKNSQPNGWLLEYCFRNASRALCAFAKQNDKKAWDLETVAEFWRYHHGHDGDCAVRVATVLSTTAVASVECISVLFGEEKRKETSTAFNWYNLDLKMGDTVYIHRRVVVEKVEF